MAERPGRLRPTLGRLPTVAAGLWVAMLWAGSALAQPVAPPGEPALQASAVPGAQAADAALDARTQALATTLRCVVCQNQSLAESHAPLAEQLKARIREQLAAGLDATQVRDDLVQRYGDFVLYQPPFKPLTWALWLGPLAGLLAGAALLWRRLRLQATQGDDEPAPGDDAAPDAGRPGAAPPGAVPPPPGSVSRSAALPPADWLNDWMRAP